MNLGFFKFFAEKMLKMTISTSVWNGQHPNAGRNIQQQPFMLKNVAIAAVLVSDIGDFLILNSTLKLKLTHAGQLFVDSLNFDQLICKVLFILGPLYL